MDLERCVVFSFISNQHMVDATYGFPFVRPKSNLPPHPTELLVGKSMYDLDSMDGRFNVSYEFIEERMLHVVHKEKIDLLWNPNPFGNPNLERYDFPQSNLGEVKKVSATFYDCSKELSVKKQTITDLSDSLSFFTKPTWLMVLLVGIIIYMLIRVHFKLAKVKRENYKDVLFKNIVGQGIFPDENYSSRVLCTVVNLFVFFIIVCYFLNGTKSERISPYVPTVYDNIDDIPNNENVEMFVDLGIPHTKRLMKQFDRSTFKKGVLNRILITELLEPLVGADERIFISSSQLIVGIKRILCKLSKFLDESRKNLCVYIGYNTFRDERKLVLGLYMHPSFKKKLIFKSYMKYYRRSVDSGLRQTFYIVAGSVIVTPDTHDCYSEQVIVHEPEFQMIELSNYKQTLLALLIPLSLAIICLHFEHFKFERFSSKRLPPGVLEFGGRRTRRRNLFKTIIRKYFF